MSTPAPAAAPAPSPGMPPARAGAQARPVIPAPGSPPGTGNAPAPARVVGRRRTWLREQFEGTPGRMRSVGALVALACLLFGLVGAATLWSGSQALGRASASTEQIVRVQAIYADILRADADATNAFLVGGNEDPAQRADYEASMKRVAATLAIAAREQRADGAALAALNAEVQSYAALVEQARAYNRQGLPVGAQYQTQASDRLRGSGVPIIQSLLEQNTARAQGEFGSATTMLPLIGTGALALGGLVWASLWLARRTHRRINVGLAAATAGVLAALVAGLVVLGGLRTEVSRIQANQFAGTLALTTARSAAYDAKANESLGLIARGQAAAKREPAFTANVNVVNGALIAAAATRWPTEAGSSTALSTGWQAYLREHARVRTLDDGGTWDEAVALATAADQGTRPAFATYEKQVTTAVDAFQQALVADVAAPSSRSLVTALAVLLGGLAAALLATRGIAKRVEEYR